MGVDINDSKFEAAKKLGAHECLNSLQVPNKDIKVRGLLFSKTIINTKKLIKNKKVSA